MRGPAAPHNVSEVRNNKYAIRNITAPFRATLEHFPWPVQRPGVMSNAQMGSNSSVPHQVRSWLREALTQTLSFRGWPGDLSPTKRTSTDLKGACLSH